MCRIAVVPSIIVVVAAQVENCRGQEPAVPPVKVYDDITREYEASMWAATEARASHTTLRALGKRRAESFAKLVETAEAQDIAQFSGPDLAALAMACEYLRRRDDCIRYARLAIEREPATEGAYRPLIRSLLNANKPEIAATVLRQAELHIPAPVAWGGMYYLLYRKYARNGNWQPAISHLVVHNSRMLSALETDVKAIAALRKTLKDFCSAHESADAGTACAIHLHDYYCRAAAAVAHLREKPQAHQRDSVEVAQLLSSLCELKCELARLLDEECFEDDVRGWLGYLFADDWDGAADAVLEMHRQSFVEYVFSHSDAMDDWDQFDAMLLTRGGEGGEDASHGASAASSILLDLRRLVDGERHAQEIVNTAMSPLDEATWVAGEEAMVKREHGKPLVLLLTGDTADLELVNIQFVKYWINAIATAQFDRVWICADRNDAPALEEQTADVSSESRHATSDRLRAIISQGQIDCSCGVVRRESRLWQHFGETSLPRIVLVDGAGRIRRVIHGASPTKVKLLSEELARIGGN